MLKELSIIGIPFLGTALGAATVFFMRKEMRPGLEKLLLGFASGVMIAASVWSLLIPAIELSEEQGKAAWLPASAGFLLGMGFLLLLDSLVPHVHIDSDKPEGLRAGFRKTTMLVLAVTLHNLPEGMAVGVTFAGAMLGDTGITMAGALTVLLASWVVPILPYLLAFAAGAMIYVVVEELIPEAQAGGHTNIGTVGVAAGFVLMMILDVALG